MLDAIQDSTTNALSYIAYMEPNQINAVRNTMLVIDVRPTSDEMKLNFTARRFANAVYAVVVVCQSVRLSVRLSQAGTAPKRYKRRITRTTPYDGRGTLVF